MMDSLRSMAARPDRSCSARTSSRRSSARRRHPRDLRGRLAAAGDYREIRPPGDRPAATRSAFRSSGRSTIASAFLTEPAVFRGESCDDDRLAVQVSEFSGFTRFVARVGAMPASACSSRPDRRFARSVFDTW